MKRASSGPDCMAVGDISSAGVSSAARCVKRCFSHQSPCIELAASRQHKFLCEKSHMHEMSGEFIHQNAILGSRWVPQ